MDKETFEKQVDELTLALLYLNRFKERGDSYWRSWKGYDFDKNPFWAQTHDFNRGISPSTNIFSEKS